ncbi:phage GP46 family protein [Gilliamella sp. W8126]|uniref:phage GP46 family protein n=1 Tax=Gilliamella sp. W8126 TaxID=2750946 RepID=UPI0018DDC194|nr:phage GP46 family protein [Gilliamella sp. W8126]MBI0004927.1 phage GP46 family protein [Gilliamella sp. W8126]
MQLTWATHTADIDYKNGNEILTNIIASLFTDTRANEDDILPSGGIDKRGWWGDSFSNKKIGSKLWLLSREKQLSSVLKRAQEYAEESLQWMIKERLIKSVTVIATNPTNSVLLLTVRPILYNSDDVPEYSFTAALNNI